jgi:hemolysin III
VKRRRDGAVPDGAAAAAAPRVQSLGERIANGVTHGLGLAASIVVLTLLIVFSSLRGDAWQVVSFTVFGLALLVLYTVSALRHAWHAGRMGRLFLRFDHAAVFLLIAGTYTPFLLTSLRGPSSWILFGIIWGLCGAGAVFQFLFGGRFRLATALACVFVGWLILVALKPMTTALPLRGLELLLAGGLCYAVAITFRFWQSLRCREACWRAFVLGGGTCHFLAALLFLLPHPL